MKFSSILAALSAVTSTLAQQTYTNPVLWYDLADIDVFRKGNQYYYSASTMSFSPGAPILRSGDLVNWEFIGHSVPRLDFHDTAYDLADNKQAYVRGIWASSMQYREYDDTFYWIGCVDFKTTYIYKSKDPAGQWSKVGEIGTCYYDCGMLFDGQNIYVAYGNTKISVAQLNNDFTQKSTTQVYSSSITIEGSHMKKINNKYYIFVTQPASNEYVLKSNSGPLGPYEFKIFTKAAASGIQGSGNPHQGSVVDTPNGDWYYLAFIDAYPGGRSPVLAPFVFDAQGWPSLKQANGFAVANTYPVTPVPVKSPTGIDSFTGGKLGPQWEWNHNPDTTKFSFGAGGSGLILKTASVTKDLFHAKNTLTHRILGPDSTATISLDISKMTSGDQAGLSLFRDNAAYIAIRNNAVILNRDLALGAGWNTLSTGRTETSASLPANTKTVWLRLHADIKPAGSHQGTFSWSVDGKNFKVLGTPYTMNTTYYFFIGYRFGIFNFAENALGGQVTVNSFDLALGAK